MKIYALMLLMSAILTASHMFGPRNPRRTETEAPKEAPHPAAA